jgi:Bacterial Ig-like domain
MGNEQLFGFSTNNLLYPNQIIPESPGTIWPEPFGVILQASEAKQLPSGQLPLLIPQLFPGNLGSEVSRNTNIFANNLVIEPWQFNSLSVDNSISTIDPVRQKIAASFQPANWLDAPAIHSALAEKIDLAQQQIASFFQQPDLAQQLSLAFGQGVDLEKAKSYSQWLPSIEVVPDSILGKANGAYAASNNTIFLAHSLVERGDRQEIIAVLVEEIGHSIDAHLNASDSPGDEGEIFAKLVSHHLDQADYLGMLAEDDHNQIIWQSHALAVENSTPSQPIHSFAIQATGIVSFNGKSDLDGNPLDITDDAFVYAGKGFNINGQSTLPVQRNLAGNPLTNSAGKLLLVDQAFVVAPGYLQSNSSSNNNYTNLNPPQIVAQQNITIPSYADIKQQELAKRIPSGLASTTFNAQLNTINNANQWLQKFPQGGTATQPKYVRVTNGSLNIPVNVNLSNYVIVVDSGDINFQGNGSLTNVVLVTSNGNINLNPSQISNSSILASGTINSNGNANFVGSNLLATGQGNITLQGVNTGTGSSQNLRLISQGQITFNGNTTARGEFRSVGTFTANGSSDIYGLISSKQDVVFNGNSTFTYANTGNNPSVITTPTIQLSSSSDTGTSNSDRVTSILTPIITGTGDVGATIKLIDGAVEIGQTTVALDGHWQITASPLINGNHSLTASASFGTNSLVSTPLPIIIDNVAPQIQISTLLNTIQNGSKLAGTVNGTGSAVASLTYQWDSQAAIPVALNATGGFDQLLDFTGIGSGTHQLTLVSIDLAGNSSSLQSQILLDSNAPVIAAALAVDSGISSSDKITNSPAIAGTVADASQITEFKAGFDGQTLANFKSVLPKLQNGNFTFSKPDLEQIYGGVIPDGMHSLNLVAKDQYGNQSSVYTFSFTLDTTIQIPTLNLALGSDSGVVGDSRTKAATVNLTGKTEANARVILSGNPTPITADAQGNFTFTNLALTPKANSFTVTTTDIAGNIQTYTQVIYRTSPPTAVNLSTPVVLENSISGLLVGSLTSIDPDGVDNYGYSLVDNAGGRFQLAGDKILVANGSLLDFEANQQHQIQVRTTDSEGDSYLQTIAIDVKNVNEAPLNFALSSNTAPEKTPVGSVIGNFTTINPDAGDTHAYSLVNGVGDSDNNAFTISSNQLRLQVSPDFETKSSYALRVKTTDAGGLSIEKQLTVNITNVNEAPTSLVLDVDRVSENSPVGTVIGKLTSTDPDVGDTHSYSLITGNGDQDNTKFSLTSNELRLNFVPDFETQSVYHLRLQTTDAGD